MGPPNASDVHDDDSLPSWLAEPLKAIGVPDTRAAAVKFLQNVRRDAPALARAEADLPVGPERMEIDMVRRDEGGDAAPSLKLVLRALEEAARATEGRFADLKAQLADLETKVPLATVEHIQRLGLEAVDGDGGGLMAVLREDIGLGGGEERRPPAGGRWAAAPGAARQGQLHVIRERLDEARLEPLRDRLAHDARTNANKMKVMGTTIDTALRTVDPSNLKAARKVVLGVLYQRLEAGGVRGAKEFRDDLRITVEVAKGKTPATVDCHYVTLGFPTVELRQSFWSHRQLVTGGQDRDIQVGSVLSWLQRQYRQRCIAEGNKMVNEATQYLFYKDHEVFVGHKSAADRAAHRTPQLVTVAPDQLLDLLPQARRA